MIRIPNISMTYIGIGTYFILLKDKYTYSEYVINAKKILHSKKGNPKMLFLEKAKSSSSRQSGPVLKKNYYVSAILR